MLVILIRPTEISFTVDETAGTTKYSFAGEAVGTTISPNTSVSLSSKDTISGSDRVFYSLDSAQHENFKRYNRPIDIKSMREGSHKLQYYSIDHVGNKERDKALSFYVDRTAPKVSIDVLNDKFRRSGNTYVSTRSTIQVTATDNKVKVQNIEYSIDTKRLKHYNKPFTLNSKQGVHFVYARATDELKNQSSLQSRKYYLDRTPPSLSYRFYGPHYKDGNISLISGKTKINITSTDKESGLEGIYYLLDGEWKKYTGAFTIKDEGKVPFEYYARDFVNNRSVKRYLNIVVDKSPPEIFFRPSSKKVSEKEINGRDVETYPSNTSIYISATDANSRIDRITYRLNNSREKTLDKETVYPKTGGLQHFQVKAYDRVGNVAEKDYYIYIEKPGVFAH